jgi:uncharacterized protein (TIGR03437 family)
VVIRLNNTNIIPAFAGISGPGSYQINFTIPPGAGTGEVPIVATVAGVSTQSGVVLSLQ